MRTVETDEQQQLRTVLRDLFTRHCPPPLVRAAKTPPRGAVDGSASPPTMTGDHRPAAPWTALWRELADSGTFGVPFDTAYGGQGGGLAELAILHTEAGRALCPTPVYSTLLLGIAIDRLADEATKRAVLPGLCSGEIVGSTACWNPSDAADLSTGLVAERDSVTGRWEVTGTLPAVIAAQDCDLLLVTAETRGTGGDGGRVGFLLRPGGPGWQLEPLHTIAGDPLSRLTLRSHPVADLGGDGSVPAVLGSDGDVGLDPDELRWVAQVAVALTCSEMVGGTQAVLERTAAYATQRHQFGRPIGSFQAVQHLIADMRIDLDAARLATAQAVAVLADGAPSTRQTAIAAIRCSRAYPAATLTAHQIHGGMGYVLDTDLHLWSERAKVAEVLWGTAETATGWLAAQIGATR